MRQRQHERGAALVIVALFMTTLAMFTVLAANVGLMVHQRTRLQAAADAAALAGAGALDFGEASASATAKQYALSNGYTLQDQDITIENGTSVRVTLSQSVGLMLGELISTSSMNVSATAKAQFLVLNRGLRPLGYPYQPSFDYGTPYLIKQSDKGPGGMVLNLDGNGASSFESSFKYGSDKTYKVGDPVDTKSNGNDTMKGPTQKAFQFLYDKNPKGTYAEARQSPGQNPRVVTIALVEPVPNDNKAYRIKQFARFFLVSESQGDITAYFIDMVPAGFSVAPTSYHAKRTLVL